MSTQNDQPTTDHLLGNFYRGRIYRLFRGKREGVIVSVSGRQIPFAYMYLDFAGPRCRFEDLREGMEVGFDVGWTSRGLYVTTLYVPSRE